MKKWSVTEWILVLGLVSVICLGVGYLGALLIDTLTTTNEEKVTVENVAPIPAMSDAKPTYSSSIHDQLYLYDENGRPMFTKPGTVRSQLALP